MKYLKLFESPIKHSDPIAINNILNDFSRKIEDVIILLKKLDNFNSTVRRYFLGNGNIRIIYNSNYSKLLTVELKSNSKDVDLTIYSYIVRNNEIVNKNSIDFFNFVNFKLKKYEIDDGQYFNISSNATIKHYNFPIHKLNTILNEIEEYGNFIEMNKYNL